ncbi:MAG: hypothetical protein KGH54_03525 [Candidatus Micrarchaeota archaeon]|nr:hypothetical protein [Candidatus Micrarchaeota archaeon]
MPINEKETLFPDELMTISKKSKISLDKNEVAVMANISPLGVSTLTGLAAVTEIPMEVLKNSIKSLKEKELLVPGNYWFSEYMPSTITTAGRGQSARELIASAQRLLDLCAENPLANEDFRVSGAIQKIRDIVLARGMDGPSRMILVEEVRNQKNMDEIRGILERDRLESKKLARK